MGDDGAVRTLVILRHAKAEPPDGVADVERPLTARGHADAAAAGAWLAQRGFVPDLVLCSPARRTRQTWHGVALALHAAPTVQYEPALYAARVETLLERLGQVDDTVGSLLLIGHNPGVSDLSGTLDAQAMAVEEGGLRTAGMAVHAVGEHWAACGPGTAPITVAHTARET